MAKKTEIILFFLDFALPLPIKFTNIVLFSMTTSDSIVIIPTYNEKENIEKIIRAINALDKQFHILVIDDGSPDGTAAIVKRLMQEEFAGGLFLLERPGKLGLGTAYILGFKWALQHDYEYIFEMDADFSHDPADLPRLYAACHDEGYDLAIGSRYVSGVNVVNWPMGRVLMSYFASKYVRFVTGFKVHDTTAGFKCYRRRVLQTIELDKIRFRGYAFQIEMKFTAYKIGFRIKEVPVIFVNRREGVSKMSGGIFGEAFLGVMRLRWDGWTRRYPKIV
jgi:dolichol-phosphate mannosyltransferase